jgi:hypothetical protein
MPQISDAEMAAAAELAVSLGIRSPPKSPRGLLDLAERWRKSWWAQWCRLAPKNNLKFWFQLPACVWSILLRYWADWDTMMGDAPDELIRQIPVDYVRKWFQFRDCAPDEDSRNPAYPDDSPNGSSCEDPDPIEDSSSSDSEALHGAPAAAGHRRLPPPRVFNLEVIDDADASQVQVLVPATPDPTPDPSTHSSPPRLSGATACGRTPGTRRP